MAKMTGEIYKEKGLRKLKAKYPEADNYEFYNRHGGVQNKTVLGILTKSNEVDIFKQWLEEYLDLMEIVDGFSK